MVKLELYRVFREVAEAGNISLAAENLYLSQSAVSQSVKQLEQQLGTRLFLRSPRGVTLTEDGRLLFEYVRSAMGLLETGEDAGACGVGKLDNYGIILYIREDFDHKDAVETDYHTISGIFAGNALLSRSAIIEVLG